MKKREQLFYPEIESWCKIYLENKYKGYSVITTSKTSKMALDSYLKTIGVEIKEAIGLSIRVDIVGVLKRANDIKLVFYGSKEPAVNPCRFGTTMGLHSTD